MSDQNDDSTTFLRQRRDLFVISSVLLLIPIAGIEINNQVSMQQFGISLKISRPEVIHYSLWVLWVYWYFRYLQAYRALSQPFFKNKLNSEMSRALYSEFYELAKAEQEKLINNGELSISSEYATYGGFSFDEMSYKLLKSEYVCKFTYLNQIGRTNDISKTLTYRGWGYIWIQIKVMLKCLALNIEVTEYLFPFIFGLSPLVYCLFDNYL